MLPSVAEFIGVDPSEGGDTGVLESLPLAGLSLVNDTLLMLCVFGNGVVFDKLSSSETSVRETVLSVAIGDMDDTAAINALLTHLLWLRFPDRISIY